MIKIGLIALMILSTVDASQPLKLHSGPYLFLDDYLIEKSSGIMRTVNCPGRTLPGPVITGPDDKCFQPYVTVVRDPQTRRFRVWYGVPENASQSHLAYMESEDGIHWIRSHKVLADPDRIQFGVSILDEGPEYPQPEKRFKYAWWNDGGLRIAFSADGLSWKAVPGVVLKHNHDINNIYWDPARKRYGANVSVYTEGKTWTGLRRVTMGSTSEDLIHWAEPRLIIAPDEKDEGETQFYCMGGVLARGDVLVGMVRVLRDDLPADPGGPVAGIGYTTLAWSRDGITWTRDRAPFLDRNEPGTWDHAMSWIDCQLPVGDEVYLYYGGYARGHKVERFTERQIGLVRIPRDRYVARQAGSEEGTLTTPQVILDADAMALNADARDGEIVVQITDGSGRPIPGFTFADCKPIATDSIAVPVKWKRPLGDLRGKTVRLEFRLRQAKVYAFDLK